MNSDFEEIAPGYLIKPTFTILADYGVSSFRERF
jgi:hypothetical protein